MIVLDTHALIWWVADPKKLSKKADKLINREIKKGQIAVSSISVWEICLLVKKGRLNLTTDVDSFLQKVESLPMVQFIPVNNNIAAKSVALPGQLHDDPADRIIIATAKSLGAVLITADERIRKYTYLKSAW